MIHHVKEGSRFVDPRWIITPTVFRQTFPCQFYYILIWPSLATSTAQAAAGRLILLSSILRLQSPLARITCIILRCETQQQQHSSLRVAGKFPQVRVSHRIPQEPARNSRWKRHRLTFIPGYRSRGRNIPALLIHSSDHCWCPMAVTEQCRDWVTSKQWGFKPQYWFRSTMKQGRSKMNIVGPGKTDEQEKQKWPVMPSSY